MPPVSSSILNQSVVLDLHPTRGVAMKSRIALWAAAGAVVVVGWTLYASAISPAPLDRGPFPWLLVCLTCPIALARHLPLSVYWVLLANAATYALVGVTVEMIRHRTVE